MNALARVRVSSVRACDKKLFGNTAVCAARRKQKVARRETSGTERVNIPALKVRTENLCASSTRLPRRPLNQTFHVWLPSLCRFAAKTISKRPLKKRGHESKPVPALSPLFIQPSEAESFCGE